MANGAAAANPAASSTGNPIGDPIGGPVYGSENGSKNSSEDGVRGEKTRAEPQRLVFGAVVFFAALAVGVWTVGPALHGPFLSDDLLYLENHPFVTDGSPESLLAIWDPTHDARFLVANWAPVHLSLHAAQWQLFGPATFPYHVTNALVHAAVVALFAVLLVSLRLPVMACAAGAAWFAVHPAQVEAVAWISQLKTLVAMALTLAALLLFERRPVWSTLAFALALLSKASAAFALPTAALLAWTRPDREQAPASRRQWATVGAWTLVFAGFTAVQQQVFAHANPVADAAAGGIAESARWILSIFGRYVAMAATSLGTSPFHEPPPPRTWLEPWPIAGGIAFLAMAARALYTLARRRTEAALWAWAAFAYAPTSQIFPFLYPMGDRYLYFVLPAWIAIALLIGRDWLRRVDARWRRPALGLAAIALASLLLGFTIHSRDLARLWTSEPLLVLEAARNYPDGASSHYRRGAIAARSGDARAATAELRRATARGHKDIEHLLRDPSFESIRQDPEFAALLADLATRRIAGMRDLQPLTQANLVNLARAYRVRGEPERALEVLEQALQQGGGFDRVVRSEMAAVRLERAAAERSRIATDPPSADAGASRPAARP